MCNMSLVVRNFMHIYTKFLIFIYIYIFEAIWNFGKHLYEILARVLGITPLKY